MQSPSGVVFAPVRDGEVIAPDAFEKLPEDEQRRLQKDIEELGGMLQKAMQDMPKRIREIRARIAELDNQVTRFAVSGLIEDLVTQYSVHAEVVGYLREVERDLIENSPSAARRAA